MAPVSHIEDRAREKDESRARDAARLANGSVSAEQLRHENDFFAALDLSQFQIVEIGGRPLEQWR